MTTINMLKQSQQKIAAQQHAIEQALYFLESEPSRTKKGIDMLRSILTNATDAATTSDPTCETTT
jgi:hypothetical protein